MIPLIFKKTEKDDPDVVRGYNSTYSYVMRCCGLYPNFRGFNYYIFGFHLNCIHVAYLWFVTAYLISNYLAFAYSDIQLMSYEICYGLITIMFFLVAHYVMYRRNHLDSMFRVIGQKFYTYEKPVDEEGQAIIDDCDKLCKNTTIRNIVISSVLAAWICIIPPLPKIIRGEYSSVVEGEIPINKHLALPVWTPIPTETPLNFWIMFIYELIGGSTELFIVGSICSLFCNLCAIVCRELKLLRLALKNTRARAIYAFNMKGYTLPPHGKYEKSELFLQCLVSCIDESIKHHVVLKQFYEAIQDFMGFPIFVIFSGTALTISAPMLMLLTMTEVEDTELVVITTAQSVVLIICFVFLLSSYCLFGQTLTDESSLVHFAFYETPWVDADLNFKRKVIMGMVHSGKPFVLRAKGLASASSTTLVDILKTVYSFFNILAAGSGKV